MGKHKLLQQKGLNKFSWLAMSIFAIILIQACHRVTNHETDAMASLYCKSIVVPNQTYLHVDNIDLQLDAYIPARNLGGEPWVEYSDNLKPVLLYIHGGGWQSLNRSVRNLNFIPYIDKGFAVINIDYRLLSQAPFPACIADCRQALNWIYDNAKQYRLDTNRIVVSGESAGGHLALMTGMMNNDSVINIPGKPIHRKMKVAAVVNWFGVSDMQQIAEYWNSPDFVKQLTGDIAREEFIYQNCSPIHYLGPDNPPIISVHGDVDNSVPVSHSVTLHQGLSQNHVNNKLIIVKGKKHGDFDEQEMSDIFRQIWQFLKENKIMI